VTAALRLLNPIEIEQIFTPLRERGVHLLHLAYDDGHYNAQCPCHPEAGYYLRIVPQGDAWAVHCEAGCRFDAIVSAGGLEGLVVPWVDPDAKAARFAFLSDLELQNRPPIASLVGDVLPQNALTAMYGPPGGGKSMNAVDLACSVAAGCDWMGKTTLQGPVIYNAAEGSAGLSQRVSAWKEHQGIGGISLPVHFLTEPVNLLNALDVAAFLSAVDSLQHAPVLIIIDTLARSMAGGDENSAKDVGLVIENADKIRRATGATVLLIHHTAKGSETERGSSSLRGAVDALLYVKADDAVREIRCEKAKDWAAFEPIAFRIRTVGNSAVAEPAQTSGTEATSVPSGQPRQMLVSLGTSFLADGASFSDWQIASGVPKTSFFRHRTTLVRSGYVAETKSGRSVRYTLTGSGRYVISSAVPSSSAAVPHPSEHSSSTVPLPFRGGTSGTD
jgi:hypothetical protein